LPQGVSLLDLGSVRLKGLSTSEAVFQVMHPRLDQSFPALRELEATPNNLPQQLTSFIGRERECAEVAEMLTTARLLTLLGMGGLGKTRLSLQIGTDVMDLYPDGVWFIDLQAIRDGSLVASEAARVLSVREEPGRPLLQTLCAHVKSRKLLLILDNCEQVIDASAELANALLRSAPDVRILTTSRIALRVPGEQTYVVQPLPLPSRTASFEALSQSTAVQLFVERAKLHKPAFTLTEREAPAIAELVSRLEGIPLALELAAARVRSLAVADINKRLNDRYKILTGGDRTLQARQQTLRALVDWSYDLLNENEQALLARLSVFAGGFSLESAEAICGADPLTTEDVLDLITSLAEKSLVNMEDGDAGTRYRMLETLRDYGREKLAASGEQPAIAAAHCDHFLTFAKAARPALEGPDQAEWMLRVEENLDDLRAAIKLALDGGVDPIIAVKFAVALLGFWMLRGYVSEGRSCIRAALALPAVQASNIARAHALYVGAALADSQSQHTEALGMLEQCLVLRRGLGDAIDIAAALSTLSLARLHAGDAEGALAGETEALAIFRTIGNRTGEGIVLLHLGQIHAFVGDDEQARRHFDECWKIALGIENSELESECELNIGELALWADDLPSAFARFSRSVEVSREAGDKRGEATALWWSGKAELANGSYDAARVKLGGALRAFQAFEMYEEMLGGVEDHAALFRMLGDDERSARLYAAAQASRERLALTRGRRFDTRVHGDIEALRASLGSACFDTAWTDGANWELGHAIACALVATEREVAVA
ncbi:MAG: NB-ARC domain-containing protein, partial [Casimicrobiaceae bacterium]